MPPFYKASNYVLGLLGQMMANHSKPEERRGMVVSQAAWFLQSPPLPDTRGGWGRNGQLDSGARTSV